MTPRKHLNTGQETVSKAVPPGWDQCFQWGIKNEAKNPPRKHSQIDYTFIKLRLKF